MAKDESKVKNSAAKKRRFFHDVIAEAGRVNWPDLKKSKKAVASVFFVLVMFSLAIWLFDTSIQTFGRVIGFYNSEDEMKAKNEPNFPLVPAQVPTTESAVSSDEKTKETDTDSSSKADKQEAKAESDKTDNKAK